MWRTRVSLAAVSTAFRGRSLSNVKSVTIKRTAGTAYLATKTRIQKPPVRLSVPSGWTCGQASSRNPAALRDLSVYSRTSVSSDRGWGLTAAATVASLAFVWCVADTPKNPQRVVQCSAGLDDNCVEAAAGTKDSVTSTLPVSTSAKVTGGLVEVGGDLVKYSPIALSLASEYNANSPMEDRHDVRESPRGDFFASVYDGHGGWQCAEFARKRLNIAAQTELNNSLAKSPEQVKEALTRAFSRVEREYLYQVKTAFELGFGAVARTGSCALVTLVRDGALFVANAGDCRAVLGRRKKAPVGAWGGDVMETVALSNDHNAKEKTEQEKLQQLHPSEDDIVKCKRKDCCYVKGRLQPTRSLGDAYLKYSEFNGQAGMHKSGGRFLPPPYTPPYISAQPEIHVHNIDTSQDEFVVLASDGLWDFISSAEAVDIVQTAAYKDGSPSSAGDRLIEAVLERAAAKRKLSVEELKNVQEGPERRSKHDDITCLVFFLEGNEKNAKFGALNAANMAKQNKPALAPSV